MKNIILAILALFLLVSCDKNTSSSGDSQQITGQNSTEPSLEQEPLKLKNSKGEELTVIYFAEGDKVAVKIQKAGEAEQKLTAKTTNSSGNPVFTNDEFMWEITKDGRAGKLSDKDGNGSEYKEP